MTNQKTPEQGGATESCSCDGPPHAYDPKWCGPRSVPTRGVAGDVLGRARAEAEELTRQGYPTGVLLRILADAPGVQGGATEEQVEAALSAASRVRREHEETELERRHGSQDMRECGTICRTCGWQLKPMYAWQSADAEGHDEAVEREAIRAALLAASSTASAHPAGERHDAEEREAESENHAATTTGDREKLIDRLRYRSTLEARGATQRRHQLGSLLAEAADALAAPVEVDEAKLAEAKFSVESVHHFHGADCLCGFSSHRSRSRTEHITDALAAILRGEGR